MGVSGAVVVTIGGLLLAGTLMALLERCGKSRKSPKDDPDIGITKDFKKAQEMVGRAQHREKNEKR